MWETEILSQNAVFCCMYNFMSQCCLSGCETLHTSALKNISILDITMSSSLSRLDPDNAHTLWHDKQFQWFVAVGAFGLLIALTEAVRWLMVVTKVNIFKTMFSGWSMSLSWKKSMKRTNKVPKEKF